MLLVVALVFIGILLPACTDRRASPAQEADGDGGDGQQGTQERSSATHQKRTTAQGERDILTGTITKRGEGLYQFRKKPGSWILVEENPNADCSRHKRPLRPGCQKMYFNITGRSDVYREEGNALVKVPATRLKKGQKIRADYTGYDVAESYFGQTEARRVVIMGTP